MRPPDEVKKEIVRQWLAKAEQDAWHQIEFPKTHAIEQLLDLIKRVDL